MKDIPAFAWMIGEEPMEKTKDTVTFILHPSYQGYVNSPLTKLAKNSIIEITKR